MQSQRAVAPADHPRPLASAATPPPGLQPRRPLDAPLRSLALTVEAAGPGEFRWRLLEDVGHSGFQSIASSPIRFAAYDAALATGYGELQRLIGADLQYGPRADGAQSVARPAVTGAVATVPPADVRATDVSASLAPTSPPPKEITA